MSTNYYIRKKPTKDQIKNLKNLIDLSIKDGSNFKTILNEAHKLYDLPDEYADDINEWGVLHIGHRECDWKFSWLPNLIKINQSYIDENRNFVHMPNKYKERYPLTKQGIRDFIMNDNYVIVNEYDEILDKDEFLDMAFNWYPNGYNSISYHQRALMNPNYVPYSWAKDQEPFKTLGFTFSEKWQTDFESDGLRFTIFTNFL